MSRSKNDAWFPWCSTELINEPRNLMIFICVRGSIWNEFFYILRLKKIKKEISPKRWWVNTHWSTNILFKSHVTDRMWSIYLLEKTWNWQEFLQWSIFFSFLRSPIDRCYRKGNAFCDFGFENKLDNFWKHF